MKPANLIPECLMLFAMAFLVSTGLAKAALPQQASSPHCYRPVNRTGACVPLTQKTCLGTALPFTHTSISLVNDSHSLDEVYVKLGQWAGLQGVPDCWAIVQPFLCSVYLPRCNASQGVELPSEELCERTRKPCRIVAESKQGWPDFLKCDHSNFIKGCGSETYDKLVFNTTGRCEPPLVLTTDPDSWYHGVEGCGVPCENPLFTKAEHKEVHTFVAVFGSICLVCTLFTVLTFIIDWKNANRYPALILFFINACFFLGSIGWMAQFAGDARQDIVCRKDGTVRKGEPHLSSSESISCTVVFVIVYYFLVAGISWFVMLAYAWYLTFTALGTPRDTLTSRTTNFHMISWCVPLVLTIICLAISEVDGDSMSGICFVGGFNHGIRAAFVLVPVGLVIIMGTFFLLKGVYTLVKIRKEAPVFIPEKTFSKIRDTIVRLGVFTAMALTFVVITFAVHVYIFANEKRWRHSFRDYMYCIANASISVPSGNASSSCVIEHRPSLIAMEIHIFAFFGAGIAMSSWSWTKATLSAWERFFRWVFHKPSNKPVKLKRHRMIAQAFEKRREINQGRVSISYRSSHDDPLGMKFDLNSGTDDELSSNFAMAMPNLVRRRGGLIFPVAGMGRRYSDSDVQSVISTRRVSLESQRMEFHEAQFVIIDRDQLALREGKRSRKKLKQKKRGRLNRVQPGIGTMFSKMRLRHGFHRRNRKESDSSMMSQMSAQSVREALGRNSLDTVSLESNQPPDTILPAVTKSCDEDGEITGLKSPAKLNLSLSKQEAVFAPRNGSAVGGAVGGHGGASSGMESEVTLPGALDEKPAQRKAEKGSLKQQQHQHQQQQPQQQERQQQPYLLGGANSQGRSRYKFNGSISNLAPQSQNVNHHVISSSSRSKEKSKTFTMETTDLASIPFSPLMADIGGGNWGVLLGKSGSSSGSEAGGGASAFMGGARPTAWGSAVGRSNPKMGVSATQVGGVPPQRGRRGSVAVGLTPVMHDGGFAGYPGGGGLGGEGGMYPGSMYYGGARPKVKENMGHFPNLMDDIGHYPGLLEPQAYYPFSVDDGSRGQNMGKPTRMSRLLEKRRERERARERQMRRPNQAFFNSTFAVDEDGIESISA